MENSRIPALLALFLFLLGPSAAFAARPLITEDTETVEKGKAELEAGFDYLRDEDHLNHYSPSAVLKYGLLDRAEAGASFGYIRRDVAPSGQSDGWSDLVVYLKVRLWDEGKHLPSAALKPLIKFPTASRDKEMGSGKVDYGIGPIFSKTWSDFRFHLDAIYLFVGERHEGDTLSTGAAVEVEFVKTWVAVGEVRYENNFNSHERDDPLLVNFGLKKEIGRVVLDAAFNLGLNRAAPDYGFTAGVTIGF